MDLRGHILKRAKPCLAPNKKTYSTLTLSDRDGIACSLGVPKRDIEIAALETEVVPQRYLRNVGSLGMEGQKELLRARALLVGAGGLGGTIALLLARMGLGTLIIADGDSFSEDNLNRQAFCFEESVGAIRVKAAHAEIMKINAATEVKIFEGYGGEKKFLP